MISTMTILMAVLVGPGAESGTRTAANEPAARRTVESAFATSREARAAVATALRESNRASGRDLAETTPSVLAAYRQLGVSENVPITERRRLQAQLRTRLSELQDVLHRRVVRARSGGGVAGQAQQLIDLIQSTIAPETWAVNGGDGTLFFDAPLNVLVVRQTAEIHEQLGGNLGQLRR